MYLLTGSYETKNGSKLLQQLCKHFGHKIEVSYNETAGKADFIFGPAFFSADAQSLTVKFELKDQSADEAARHVIDSHLEKFAFREDFSGMIWHAQD